jgi:hypothetical protein
MKTRFLAAAAAAAISLGIGSAFAGDGEGPAGGYVYPDYIVPGSIYAGVPTQNTPRGATAQNGQATHIYGTHSQSQGIWLFPPSQAGGGGSN